MNYYCEPFKNIKFMNTKDFFYNLKEGRRIEFKGEIPASSDLAKTIVAFANDAGGEVYIGVDNNHNVIGLSEDELPQLEEKLSSIIFDRCYPTILPEISFQTVNTKNIIKIRVYKGSMPPYYLKNKGKLEGTYIRVGSTNRVADENIIAELERKRRNLSFDGAIVMDKELSEIDFDNFKQIYKDKTDEELTIQVLRKLELIKEEQNKLYPTNALILFSDDELRYSIFPNAKIECSRFKGVSTEDFIDQKTISLNIVEQAEEAYNFVIRHINKGATIEGIYTIPKWEYPIKAVREVIRNAVVHRQYSLLGKDIKVAIYDDMVEITSPGLLPPSIDYSAMSSRQSDAINKIIAPVFKKLGVIDQRGNGLKMIAEELKQYPNIEFKWYEVGLSFQVQFINKEYKSGSKSGGKSGGKKMTKELMMKKVISLLSINAKITVQEISDKTGFNKRQCERLLAELKNNGKIIRNGSPRNGEWKII